MAPPAGLNLMSSLHDDAPLFWQFWRHGELNPARRALMLERIERDAAQGSPSARPIWPAAATPLPHPDRAVDTPWARRRSERHFAPRPLAQQALSNLLWPLSERADGHRQLASGGGKYPLRVYVVGLALTAIDPAVHWYDPQRHGLTRCASAPDWQVLAEVLGWADSRPAAVLVVTGLPEGMVAKYGERGGRFLMLEAGSYLGALQWECARAGLGSLALGSYDDQRLLQLIQADPDRELAVAVCAVGHPARP